ncbi:protein ecdysoneless homolog [Diadema antillarum]|uniref:protein ecdysoneless homolog n=1 Tax=Diadema antillarum TaxID=105358 RepID=UPI003A83E83D
MESVNHVQNVVEYDLFPNVTFQEGREDVIRSQLEELRVQLITHISPLLVDYIWQRDQFNLTLLVPTGGDCPPHLHGVTDFGDNVDDEWVIVYFLSQLTAAFPGLVACVQDNDGDFLLIEAAYHLPKWLEPETSINRVFIYDGSLHIIPKPNNPAELAFLPVGVPTKSHAVQTVRHHSQRTLANSAIREVVSERIRGFPGKIYSNFHHTHCLVPAKLATVLGHQPGLVAPAVDAFYQRDPLDLKACRVMKHFPPQDLVMMSVKFTRCLYAQLSQQHFTPDRRSGWKLPSSSSPKFRLAELGMKLAHGFEILCANGHQGKKAEVNESKVMTPDPDDVASGVRWERFLKSLREKGFFRGELAGSRLHRELLTSAKRFYAETVVTQSHDQPSSSSWREPAQQIFNILRTVPCDLQRLKEQEQNLPPLDSDSWMELSVEELDAMIAKASGKEEAASSAHGSGALMGHEPKADASTDVDFDPGRVTESLKSFVDAMSGLKGAEFPAGAGNGDIDFDASEFERAMWNILALDFRDAGRQEDDSDSDLMSDKDYQMGDDDGDDDDDDEAENDDDGGEDDEEIRELMEQMDQELARTEVGQSFEKEPVATGDSEVWGVMDQAGQALGTAGAVGPSHSLAGRRERHKDEEEEDEDKGADGDADDAYRPVEVDLNLLKNILESYSSQQGLAGPASNILHSMGVRVPMNADDGDR